jgi:hypothetical protein
MAARIKRIVLLMICPYPSPVAPVAVDDLKPGVYLVTVVDRKGGRQTIRLVKGE